MERLILILADSGVELVPPELWNTPPIVKEAKRRGKKPSQILLDISLHYSSMRKLNEWWKRGRPDILHVTLLVATSSLLYKRGLMDILFHTYKGRIFQLSRNVRLPRNYNRFKGLIEQLLIEGQVPPRSRNPLIYEVNDSLRGIIRKMNIDAVFTLDESGSKINPLILGQKIVQARRPAVIIGCFQHGSFGKDVSSLEALKVSIAPITFDAWYVAAKTVSVVEDTLDLFSRW